MRTLLIQLPLSAAAADSVYAYAWIDSAHANQALSIEAAALSLLPRAENGSDVALIVPASALSWHRVTLPKGLAAQPLRLQAALQGLLEEDLLQEPEQIHMALQPDWKAETPAWVCACNLEWLKAHVQLLESVGLQPQRLIPEFSPPAEGSSWYALTQAGEGWLWNCDAEEGVTIWPLAALSELPQAWRPNTTIHAEPSLCETLQAANLQTQLANKNEHWRQAFEGRWNLAQLGLKGLTRARWQQKLRKVLDALWNQKVWQPARWGAVALILTQILGLNVWAWSTRLHWAEQQLQWQRILQESFPKVTVVVDAPLQMEREVQRLQQRSGQLTTSDFEAMLSALGGALPPNIASPSRLNYQNGQLQWFNPGWTLTQASTLKQALQARGYTVQQDANHWQMRQLEGSQ